MAYAVIASAIEVQPGATRVQLFPGYGTWHGRNGAVPYTIADRAQAERIIATTRAAQGSTDLMIDYDHQAATAPGVAGTAIAAGWFRDMSADDAGLWAEGVQWTAAASARLSAREYRYASPYFLHDKAGRITRVLNAALTNTPNFDMLAVAASAAMPQLGAISPAERAVIDRLGLSDAAYLTARDEDRASTAAYAETDDQVWELFAADPRHLSAAELEMCRMLNLQPQAFLDAKMWYR